LAFAFCLATRTIILHSRSHGFELLSIAPFWCYSEHFGYYSFFYICSLIIIKFDQGVSLRLSAKALRWFLFSRIKFIWYFTPVIYIIKSTILFQAVPFTQNSSFAGL
jgi:hypothetical protein